MAKVSNSSASSSNAASSAPENSSTDWVEAVDNAQQNKTVQNKQEDSGSSERDPKDLVSGRNSLSSAGKKNAANMITGWLELLKKNYDFINNTHYITQQSLSDYAKRGDISPDLKDAAKFWSQKGVFQIIDLGAHQDQVKPDQKTGSNDINKVLDDAAPKNDADVASLLQQAGMNGLREDNQDNTSYLNGDLLTNPANYSTDQKADALNELESAKAVVERADNAGMYDYTDVPGGGAVANQLQKAGLDGSSASHTLSQINSAIQILQSDSKVSSRYFDKMSEKTSDLVDSFSGLKDKVKGAQDDLDLSAVLKAHDVDLDALRDNPSHEEISNLVSGLSDYKQTMSVYTEINGGKSTDVSAAIDNSLSDSQKSKLGSIFEHGFMTQDHLESFYDQAMQGVEDSDSKQSQEANASAFAISNFTQQNMLFGFFIGGDAVKQKAGDAQDLINDFQDKHSDALFGSIKSSDGSYDLSGFFEKFESKKGDLGSVDKDKLTEWVEALSQQNPELFQYGDGADEQSMSAKDIADSIFKYASKGSSSFNSLKDFKKKLNDAMLKEPLDEPEVPPKSKIARSLVGGILTGTSMGLKASGGDADWNDILGYVSSGVTMFSSLYDAGMDVAKRSNAQSIDKHRGKTDAAVDAFKTVGTALGSASSLYSDITSLKDEDGNVEWQSALSLANDSLSALTSISDTTASSVKLQQKNSLTSKGFNWDSDKSWEKNMEQAADSKSSSWGSKAGVKGAQDAAKIAGRALNGVRAATGALGAIGVVVDVGVAIVQGVMAIVESVTHTNNARGLGSELTNQVGNYNLNESISAQGNGRLSDASQSQATLESTLGLSSYEDSSQADKDEQNVFNIGFYQDHQDDISYINSHFDFQQGDKGKDWDGGDNVVSTRDLKELIDGKGNIFKNTPKEDRQQAQHAAKFLLETKGSNGETLWDHLLKQEGSDSSKSDNKQKVHADTLYKWMGDVGARNGGFDQEFVDSHAPLINYLDYQINVWADKYDTNDYSVQISKSDVEKIANDSDQPQLSSDAAKLLLNSKENGETLFDMLDKRTTSSDSGKGREPKKPDDKISKADIDNWLSTLHN
ncbi:type III effector HrpK domain-containing protein [Carnimonas bestiolae]|uniref:type III effector HrpK domain-containing protein n=1 Tax=Carnimonas bestiolae TaxID=3402172 RepID=UPI003EDC5760